MCPSSIILYSILHMSKDPSVPQLNNTIQYTAHVQSYRQYFVLNSTLGSWSTQNMFQIWPYNILDCIVYPLSILYPFWDGLKTNYWSFKNIICVLKLYFFCLCTNILLPFTIMLFSYGPCRTRKVQKVIVVNAFLQQTDKIYFLQMKFLTKTYCMFPLRAQPTLLQKKL